MQCCARLYSDILSSRLRAAAKYLARIRKPKDSSPGEGEKKDREGRVMREEGGEERGRRGGEERREKGGEERRGRGGEEVMRRLLPGLESPRRMLERVESGTKRRLATVESSLATSLATVESSLLAKEDKGHYFKLEVQHKGAVKSHICNPRNLDKVAPGMTNIPHALQY